MVFVEGLCKVAIFILKEVMKPNYHNCNGTNFSFVPVMINLINY